MEPIDYKRAITRRWPLILVCAVVGAIVAVLIPVHESANASQTLWQAQALASVSPSKDSSSTTSQVSQVEFYSQQQPVYQATAKALKLKIGVVKLRSEISLKSVKAKKKTYPPGSFFVQAQQPTKAGAASMANQFVKQLAAYITKELVLQRNTAIKQSTAEIASLNGQILSVNQQINALTKKPPSKSKTPPTTTTTKPKTKTTTTTSTSSTTTTSTTTTTTTSAPHTHVVPDVTGDDIGGACAAIATQGLSCTPTSDDIYAYSSSVPNNRVITTDPPPGSVLPAGSLVKLVVSKGPAPAGGNGTTTTTATTAATTNGSNGVIATLLASTSGSTTSTTSSSASKNQLAALQTKLKALQQEYSGALQHLQGLQNAAAPVSGLTLLAPARANQTKLVPGSSNPFAHRSVRGAAGLVGGAIIGIAIALLLDALDKRLRKADRASQVFGLPVIAEVPKRQRGRSSQGAQRQSGRKKGTVGIPQPVAASAFVAVTDEPTSLAAEAYRRLRVAVMFESTNLPEIAIAPVTDGLSPGGPDQLAGSADVGRRASTSNGSTIRRQVVLVVSPTLEPTAPEVVANLAAAYAEAGQTALVVTTNDLRSKVGGYTAWANTPEPPTVQTRVVESANLPTVPSPGEPTQPLPVTGAPAQVGPMVAGRDARGRGPLTVEEVAAHCRPQQIHGVLRLELGELLAGPGEMAGRGNQVLEATRQIAEVVLVEVPSLLATPDAEAISRSADAIVVVAECYYTTVNQATRSAGLLRRIGAPVLGIVLTAVDMTRRDMKKMSTSLPPANIKDAPAYAARTGS